MVEPHGPADHRRGTPGIKGLTELRSLVLNGALISDAGLKQLAGLRRLEFLVLTHVPVTDAGLQYLKGLTQLRLDLQGTSITDAGLKQFYGLVNLRRLNVRPTYHRRRRSEAPASVASMRYFKMTAVDAVGLSPPAISPYRQDFVDKANEKNCAISRSVGRHQTLNCWSNWLLAVK